MDTDERIGLIMEKIESLPAKLAGTKRGEFIPRWNAPLKEETVADYERSRGVKLPEDYRRFITSAASGGDQPFYGLYGLTDTLPDYCPAVRVDKKFPCTVRKPFDIDGLTDGEYDFFFTDGEDAIDRGYVRLCHEGCGIYSILIVNSDDKDTYGTVWFYDLDTDYGAYPLINPKTGGAMGFLDWLEYYADRTAGLGDSDYFTYGELAGVVKGPGK